MNTGTVLLVIVVIRLAVVIPRWLRSGESGHLTCSAAGLVVGTTAILLLLSKL